MIRILLMLRSIGAMTQPLRDPLDTKRVESASTPRLPETHLETLNTRVQAILEEHVRPQLHELGIDVELIGIENDAIVQVRLLGACQGCTPDAYHFIMLIERSLKAYLSEIRIVEVIT